MFQELKASIHSFQAELSEVDEVAHLLLKGHLLLEEALSRILDQHVFHREHLKACRLRFNEKVHLCRALCLRKHRLGEWDLVVAINQLRNELAHNLQSAAREKKVNRVKELYFREAAGLEGLDDLKGQPDAVILFYACAHCAGFLASFEADARALRVMIHTMDRALHPSLPEFDL